MAAPNETKRARPMPWRLFRQRAQSLTRTRAFHFVSCTLREFSEDRVPSVAASTTFFFLLALFPGIACVVSIYGMFADRASIAGDLQRLSGFLPGGATTVLKAQLDRLAAQPSGSLGVGFLAGLVVAIWSASGGVGALIEGLDIAYEVKESRSFLRLTAHALILTTAAVVFFLAAIAIDNMLPQIIVRLPVTQELKAVLEILVWPIAFVGCTVLLSFIYRYGPDRTGAEWRWFTWGGAVASAVWIGGTVLFAWYVQHFGHYDRVYGNLGAIVGFLTWIWLSVLILLLGAEINREIERGAQAIVSTGSASTR